MGKRVSQCSTPDVLIIEEELAVFGISEAADNRTVAFLIANPTVKLHMVATIFVRPGPGVAQDAHEYTGETWQLTAATDSAPHVDLNPAFTDNAAPPVAVPRPLPDSWEAQSGIKVVRGSAYLIGFTAEENNQPAGTAIVRVTWEPVDPDMTDAERAKWFGLCDVNRIPSNGALPELA